MKHIGLFEGIGGFSLSAQLVGWETIAWCEWDAFCQTVLKYHFPHATPHSDIRTTDFTGYHGKIDILTGGFPCQPYSTAGKRKGTDDERHLWPEMRRAIREISPRWVVGENVGGLISWNGGLVFEQVQVDLEAEGYEVQAFVLPACGVDAPHKRDRVWFVAHSKMHNDRGSAGEVSKTNGRQVCELLSELGCSDEAPAAAANATGSGRFQVNSESKPGLATQNIPDWRQFPTQPPLCSRNDGFSPELVGITVSKHRRESIKAYGNAIVSQVALQIFKAINQIEKQ